MIDDDKPLADRVAELEVRAGTRRRDVKEVKGPSLVELNRKAAAMQREKRAEKRSALGQAKAALEKTFATNGAFKTPDRRTQKPVAPMAAELTAQATKK